MFSHDWPRRKFLIDFSGRYPVDYLAQIVIVSLLTNHLISYDIVFGRTNVFGVILGTVLRR